MKEAILFVLIAIVGLTVLGFSVHMLIGGLVSSSTEHLFIIGACLVGILILSFMLRDVLKRRKIH